MLHAAVVDARVCVCDTSGILLLGADGGIDFDAVRVYEECKQSCTVKNKGKYDISFSYVTLCS